MGGRQSQHLLDNYAQHVQTLKGRVVYEVTQSALQTLGPILHQTIHRICPVQHSYGPM